jgi:hypothetical protein
MSNSSCEGKGERGSLRIEKNLGEWSGDVTLLDAVWNLTDAQWEGMENCVTGE